MRWLRRSGAGGFRFAEIIRLLLNWRWWPAVVAGGAGGRAVAGAFLCRPSAGNGLAPDLGGRVEAGWRAMCWWSAAGFCCWRGRRCCWVAARTVRSRAAMTRLFRLRWALAAGRRFRASTVAREWRRRRRECLSEAMQAPWRGHSGRAGVRRTIRRRDERLRTRLRWTRARARRRLRRS